MIVAPDWAGEVEGVMHEGQIDVAPSALASAIAMQFSECAGYPVERIDSAGTVVAPFRIGDDMVARLPLVPIESDDARESVRVQQEYSVVLAHHLRISVPRPIGVGRPFPSYPGVWSLWTWLPGRSLDRLTVARDRVLAKDLADTLRTIQDLPTEGRSWNGQGRGSKPLADTAWVRASIDRASNLIDRDQATAVWERALEAPPMTAQRHAFTATPRQATFSRVMVA